MIIECVNQPGTLSTQNFGRVSCPRWQFKIWCDTESKIQHILNIFQKKVTLSPFLNHQSTMGRTPPDSIPIKKEFPASTVTGNRHQQKDKIVETKQSSSKPKQRDLSGQAAELLTVKEYTTSSLRRIAERVKTRSAATLRPLVAVEIEAVLMS